MKQFLIVLLLVGGSYQLYQKIGNGYDPERYGVSSNTLMIYGRDSCPRTSKMRKALNRAGVYYQYQVVDQQSVADQLHQMMRSDGINTRSYQLPVVIWNEDIEVNPSFKKVAGLIGH